jgi:3-oxoacyl-[acyl-carrier protein] reductase
MRGRVAIVTGASRGIGRATATVLARRDFSVMAVARSAPELRSLEEEEGVRSLAVSLTDPGACAWIVEETRSRLGPIDVLVNNAGVDTNRERPIWDQQPDVWRETFTLNVDVPFELTRLAVQDMIERRWGRVVMVSSTAGSVGGASMSAYGASKGALEAFSRCVAQDLAPYGVTCNAVAPGWVRTPMADATAAAEAADRGLIPDEIWAERAASYRAGRVVEPMEVAATVAFLTSDEASGINGEILRVALGAVW